MKKGRPPIYTCNEDYFENINTVNKAYILGFLWADGHLSNRTGLSIVIHPQDREILHFIAEEMGINTTVSSY